MSSTESLSMFYAKRIAELEDENKRMRELLKDVLKDFAERAWLTPETRARIDALTEKK